MTSPTKAPEILAPAGDEEALEAALRSGADAVYFGLDDGFNARARATNFSLERLPETMLRIHRAGARGYLTLNTLIFQDELEDVERAIDRAAEAGVDALIVQDPAVALIARERAPGLEVHASTQMTISTARAARFAEELGATRVVVPRELNLDEIARFGAESPLEMEVFVHGALCVSWSGQCLSSEAWGGRSANRGQCAQSCRMPYELLLDGERQELGELRYLLSPRDLAGVDAIPGLVELGVSGLKIEGRQKSAPYVATATRSYRRWLDAILEDEHREAPARQRLEDDLRDSALAYSRGFSQGFLDAIDHQTLVDGRFPKHRGLLLGEVIAVEGRRVRLQPETPIKPADELPVRPGQGVVFDASDPENPNEAGGPVFDAHRDGPHLLLGFGRPGPDLRLVAPEQRVWITSDPRVARLHHHLPEATGRIRLDIAFQGSAETALRLVLERDEERLELESEAPLGRATGQGLNEEILRAKFGAFGGTPYSLGSLELSGLEEGLHLPIVELKKLRRKLVAELDARLAKRRIEMRAKPRPWSALEAEVRERATHPIPTPLAVVPLCRSDAQLDAAIEAGVAEVELDWMELVGLERAVKKAREAKLSVTLATLRVHKPGEEGFEKALERLEPDALLVRHWDAYMRFREQGSSGLVLHGDFSLNVTNSLTASQLLRDLHTVTASYDLDDGQLDALLDRMPEGRVAVVAQHRVPTFHTEHCVYAHLLSEGRDHRSCGRPCEAHAIALEDVDGRAHPVIVDAGCRNTVFNHELESQAARAAALVERGVRRFRIEFVREDRKEALASLRAWKERLEALR